MLKDNGGLTRIPDVSNEANNCFGCGPGNSAGLQMKFYLNETRDAILSFNTLPGHFCGWHNIAHGGVLTALLDEAMGWASLVLLRKMILSKSLEIEFVKPVFVGEPIVVEARVLEVQDDKKTLMKAVIKNKAGEVCAAGKSLVFTYHPEAIEKMGIAGELLDEVAEVMNVLA